MKDFLLETNLNDYLSYFKMDKKSFRNFRWMLCISLLLIGTLICFLFPNPYKLLFIVIGPTLGYLGYKINYIDLALKMNSAKLLIEYAFPQFLRYFISLIQVKGNVYQAFKATIPYVNEPIKSQVELLIKRIESGNKREAYMDFADFIDTTEANMVMSIIYDFSEEGIKRDSLRELEQYVTNMYNNKTDEFIEKQVGNMENYSVYSLVLSLLFILGFVGVLLYHYFVSAFSQMNF
ncbi:type II secretion system F family protein [Heyndrickxia ginsengihumi]|uniref:type II secretion system F family protein n=1 Tax=Heyndrickxia ginsengihumi TaxID=363870 RepID=UPI00046F50D6|nr:hypothetical protein [Heyndrickxia ginsengihumi]